MPKILCVDFDGVLHSYTSGWQGANVINDPPVPGAMLWLHRMVKKSDYEVHIYSSRSKQEGGIDAMVDWLIEHLHIAGYSKEHVLAEIRFPTEKPPAYLTIDDRAICFRGTFPSVLEMDNFKPWNK